MWPRVGFGVVGAAALLPAPAYAAEGGLAAVPAVLAFLAFLAVLGLAYWVRNRLAVLKAERSDLAADLAAVQAVLASAPAALYRWVLDDGVGGDGPGGAESFAPGPITALRDPKPTRFADLLARFEEKDAAALEAAVRSLRTDGTEFSLNAALAGHGPVLDITGRRLRGADGKPAADLVWFAEAHGRAEALAARDRLRAVIDALPLPIWRRAAGTLRLIDANRAYGHAVDASAAQAVAEGREIGARVLGAQGRELAERARRTSMAQSESHHIVVGGPRRFMEFTEQPLIARDSEESGETFGFARDFTDLETIQAELARHISAHGDVLETVTVAIAIFSADTRLTFFNSAFARLWRLEEDWLVSEPTLDELLERLRERRRLPEYADFRAFRRQQLAMFTSLLEPEEELLHLPDDRTLRLIVSPHPFGGLTFVYEDVTDRLALERSYNTLIAVQRETLDNLYEGVAVLGSDGRLKLWNPAYAQIWKLSAVDLSGEPHINDLVEMTRAFYETEEADEAWAERKQRVIDRVTARTPSSGRLQRSDGSILQAATVPLPDGNVLLSYLDVTDSTRVERALRERNEALETAGRLKSEFIANVSYELRTPLNAIIGFAEILSNQYFGELNPRQLDYSRGILDSSHRLLSLINDILDLATIEAGYMTLETTGIDLHVMMTSVLALARERARKQNLALNFDCPPDIGTLVGDERRLKQALFNLISNALKFTPPGGSVTLGARRAGGEVALIVSDTGVGVPKEDQERIFEKFERGNPQARQSGPGLGLSLVKSFIELHGGRIELESRPGSGTTITCYLNAGTPAEEEPPPALRASGN